MDKEKKDGREWLRRYESAKANWTAMSPLWADCRRYTMPQESANPTWGVEGKPKAVPVDATAVDLLEKMVNGLHSATVSYGDRWFTLGTNGGSLMKTWCSTATREVIRAMQGSNFPSLSNAWIRLACGYGTGILYTEDAGGVPRYRNISVADGVCYETDAFGDVCVMYIEYQWTALQAVQMFGRDNPALSADVRREFSERLPGHARKHAFVHAVYPKALFGEEVKVAEEGDEFADKLEEYRPFGGVFVDKETGVIVKREGFFEFPFAVARPILASDELYGRSIPMLAMDAIKGLNRATAMMFDASAMAIRPPIGVPAGFPKLNLVPGAVMKCPMQSANQIWTYSTQANIPVGDNLIARYVEQLRSLFKEDFFMAISKKGEMSATEIAERVRQATEFVSPMVMSIQHDGFRPVVLRTLGILERAGKLPKRPERGSGVEVSFVSRIDAMTRQAEANRDMQFLQQAATVGQYIAANQDLENVLNKDAIYDDLQEAMGVRADLTYDQDVREANRRAAAEAAAQARQEEMQMQMLGRTNLAAPVSPDSVLGKNG